MSGSLWAVSCHFNPCRYTRRLANHRHFRAALGVPLLTVELSHDGTFELGTDDADLIVRRTCPDVLWQKERLINLALDELPQSCDLVAWIDADILFARDDWMAETAARLRSDACILQLYSRFTDLPAGVPPEDAAALDLPPTGSSFAALAATKEHDHELFDAPWGISEPKTINGVATIKRMRSSGFAWAARRDLLERHALYDACIVGCGDRAIACAAYGRASTSSQCSWIVNERQRAHFLRWAEPFSRDVGGRIGFVEGHVFHLWHGDLIDRRYRERYHDPVVADFDPDHDIRVDAQGCWRWNSDKPALHDFVRGYFSLRREDGNH